MVGRRPQHVASTSAYLALSSARRYSSSSRLVRLSNVVGFPDGIRSFHRLSGILLTSPAQIHLRLLTCSITSVTLVVSLSHMFLFLSRYVMFNILLSIFVCAAACLFFACVVMPMFPRRMSMLEIRMSCRFVSSSMFQCYLSIRP